MLVAALGLGGCGDEGESTEVEDGASADDLSLQLDPETAMPGDLVAARVVNRGDEAFTYGAGYMLEREVDGVFVAVTKPNRAVIQIAYEARPGATGPPVRVKVPGSAKPGRWRVVLAAPGPDGSDLSTDFEVTPGG